MLFFRVGGSLPLRRYLPGIDGTSIPGKYAPTPSVHAQMNRSMLCPVLPSGEVLSPATGTFHPNPLESAKNQDSFVLGHLQRLNVSLPLVISAQDSGTSIEFAVSDGTWLNVGDTLARIHRGHSPENAEKQHDSCICAPSDGFLVYCDSGGKPYRNTGDLLNPGDLIATLEFMKIRMDIVFDGPQGSIFKSYAQPSHSAIRCGDVICSYSVR